MEKRTFIEACKVDRVRLIESSCKLINVDLKKAKLAVSLKHEVTFSLLDKDSGGDFCINISSELKAVDSNSSECFIISIKVKADFVVFEKDNNSPDKFEAITELLGHQLFPVIRLYLIDFLVKMGLPPDVPWSVQLPPVSPIKKKTVTKSKKGRG